MWEAFIAFLTNVLIWIYTFIGGNFGLAIILFTILIRLVTHPLMVKQMKSTAAMQEFQQSKKWQDVQKKHKGDKEKLAAEQMKLMKEMGYNPFSSCLPMLIQFPIIIGLYQSVVNALAASPMQLLHLTRSLYLIPDIAQIIPLNSRFLWMDLGQPERLYLFGVGIPVLAVLVAISTYVQSKLTTPPAPSTNPNDQSAAMGKMMNIYMPFLMGYFALTFASGLAVYLITSNLVGIGQYAMLGKVNWKNLLPTFKGKGGRSK